MAEASGSWDAARMLELGRRHAALEEQGDLDALMATLVADPVYEFHPTGLCMRGAERVRRYYAQFIENFLPRTVGYELIDEWFSASAVTQEYEIRLRWDDEIESHRVIGILYAEGELLGGERVYSSELFVRRMAGDLFYELEPLRRAASLT